MLEQIHLEIFRFINDMGKQYDALNPVVVGIAEYTLYVLGAGLLIYWLTRSRANRMMVIQAVCAFIFAELLGKTAGILYEHQQPFAVLPNVNQLIEHDIDNSFPSDHTILFFSICMSFLLVRMKEGWLWLALACCVAISRIWVGVHYPIDVAVGALLGILSAVVVHLTLPKLAFVRSLLAQYEKIEQRVWPMQNKKRSHNF